MSDLVALPTDELMTCRVTAPGAPGIVARLYLSRSSGSFSRPRPVFVNHELNRESY